MLDDAQVVQHLVLALVLSGLIGLERQIRRRTAGLRTHILVCLGSCLMMLTSIHVFDIYKNVVPLDPARIAAGVITGVGFLGAGAIMVDRSNIKGLTTAASIWMVSAIGLAVGCGFYSAAIVSTVLTLAVLLVLRYVEGSVIGKPAKK